MIAAINSVTEGLGLHDIAIMAVFGGAVLLALVCVVASIYHRLRSRRT